MTSTPSYPEKTFGFCMGLSLLGLAVHNVREFGFLSLFALETGTIPMIIIGVILLISALREVRFRVISLTGMIVYGLINMIVGGILTVLPLPFLPFEPEQSTSHYLSHLIYTVTQLPLIILSGVYLAREIRDRRQIKPDLSGQESD